MLARNLRLYRARLVVLGLVLIAMPAAHGTEDLAIPLTETVFPQLEPILAQALEVSPRMVTSNLSRLQSFEESRVDALRMFPSARAYLQNSIARDSTAGPAPSVEAEKLYYNADVTQPLFHWGSLKANARVGAIRAEMARNNTIEAYRLLALEIRRDFLQLVVYRQGLENARFEKALAEKRIVVGKARVETGEANQAGLEYFENAIAESALNVDRSEFAFDSALERFRRLCGLDKIERSIVPSEIPRMAVPPSPIASSNPFVVNYVEKDGWRDSNRAQNSRLDMEFWKNIRHIDRVGLLPKFDIVTGVTQDERSYTLDVSRRDSIASLFFGIRVTWNIFDSFANKHRVRARDYSIRNSRAQAEEIRKDLIRATENAATELDFARRALSFAERSYALTASGVVTAERNLASGRGSSVELDGSQNNERNARIVLFNARASYLNSAANFLSLVEADPIVSSARARIGQH